MSDREPDPAEDFGRDDSDASSALRRVLSSGVFRRAPKARDFLAFVASEAIAGRGPSLKERTVAVKALGRGGDFQAQADASVRVQATRVRELLERYYAGEGAEDPLRISIPSGRYAPDFRGREKHPNDPSSLGEERPEWTRGPGVLVGEFVSRTGIPTEPVQGTLIAESLVHALSQFPAVRIYGPTSVTLEDLGSAGDWVRLGIRYLLDGSVELSGQTLRVTTRLSNTADGRVVSSDRYEQDLSGFTGFGATDELVTAIAARLGDYSGAVQRDSLRHRRFSDLPETYRAMLSFHRHVLANNADSAATARSELSDALVAEPDNPILQSMLGSVEAFVVLAGWSDNPTLQLQAAENLAERAAATDPRLAHARIVLAKVAIGRGQRDLGHEHCRRAVELAPGHPSILYSAGYMIAQGGDWTRAIGLIRRAVELNPHHPAYWRTLLAIDKLLRDDNAGALAEAASLDESDKLWGPTIRGLALAGLGHPEQGRMELARARSIEPQLQATVSRKPYLSEDARAVILRRIDELE